MLYRIDFKSGQAVHLQLIAQIRDAIACGALRPGEALPAIATVARELRINRNHITRAYEELESVGIIERVPGKGYCRREQHGAARKQIARERESLPASTASRTSFSLSRSDFVATCCALLVVALPAAILIGLGITQTSWSTFAVVFTLSFVALLLQPAFKNRFTGPSSSAAPANGLTASPDFDSLFERIAQLATAATHADGRLLRDYAEVLSLVNRFPALQKSLRPVPFGNDLYLPLSSQDEVIATLHLSRKNGETFHSTDHDKLARLAEDFSHTASQLRARSQRAESEYALEIQRGLLPRDIPQPPGFTIAGAWQPAKDASGDYYDVFRLNDDEFALIVADVSGKGAPAALLMSNLQASTKAYASFVSAPAALTQKVNAAICASITAGKFITFFYAVLNTRRHTLTYCNAGHNPPLLVTQSGDRKKLDVGGTVLGLFAQTPYEQATIALSPGDRLVIFTDGVLEAADSSQHEFGEDRLFTAMTSSASASAQDLRDSIMQAVTRFCGGDFADDATLLTVVVHTASAKAAVV